MLEILAEPLAPGTVLAGAYRLERIIGEGGMGVVWAATELETQQHVAVKVLADDRAADPTQHARILREAAAAKTIDHPNVVKVSAVLETDAGVPFIVMERLEGESLRALIQRRHGKLDVEPTLKIFDAVLDAVSAAHAAGILHRDLKPENVFVTTSGAVKVLDFGIAKRLTRAELETATKSLTETGAVVGTPYYMAPEQIFGDDDVDPRADVWSLGVMLYECLAGERPTEGEGFGQILKRITSASFRPLAELRPDLPPRLVQLVDKMLTRERGKRPSAGEARAKLGQLDLPPSVVPNDPSPTATTAAHPAASRSRWRTVAVGVLVVAVGAGGYAISARTHPAPAATEDDNADPMGLLLSASTFQTRGQGKACLDALDTYDKIPLSKRKLPLSTEIDGGSGGNRAACLMLSGRCEEGKRLYRRWVEFRSPDYGVPNFYDISANQMVGLYCPEAGADK